MLPHVTLFVLLIVNHKFMSDICRPYVYSIMSFFFYVPFLSVNVHWLSANIARVEKKKKEKEVQI